MAKAKKKVSGRKRAEKWTRLELSVLKKEYPNTDTARLAKKLGRSLEAVRFKAKKFRLKKTPVYMESLYARARRATQGKRVSKKRG